MIILRHWRLAVVLATTLVVFRNVVDLPFTIVDDPSFVVHNPFVADPFGQGIIALLRTTSMGYPHTVTVLSLALDRLLLGAAPAGYHAVNLALHLLNVGLFYALLRRLAVPYTAAAAAVSLFALHPLVVEPVCWVIGRKDLLSAALLFAGLLVFGGKRDDAAPLSVARWAIADALCIAAMLAKPSTLAAPALAWIFVRSVRSVEPPWRLALGLAPQIVAAALIVFVGVTGLHEQGAVVDRTTAQIAFDIVRAWSLQLQHVAWPRGLLVEYERTAEGVPSLWIIGLAMAATVAIALYSWRCLARHSVERMALLFVPLAYLPAAGFLPTQHWSADSYFYLPLTGVVLALATIGARRWPDLSGFPLVALALALVSTVQTRTWSGAVAMFQPVAESYVDDPRPLNRLAYSYAHEQNPMAAARTYVELDQIFPDFPFNRGERLWAYAYVGDAPRSESMLRRCIQLDDGACVARLFFDVVGRQRQANQISREMLAAAYPVAAGTLAQRMDANGLHAVAGWLHDQGLEDLSRRAQEDAAARDAGAPGHDR